MMCSNCAKLAFLHSKKNCIRCQGTIINNISVLCEFCSNTDSVCSVCLKKVKNQTIDKFKTAGCSSCRGK